MFTSNNHKHQPSECGKFERIASDLLSLPDDIQDKFHELHYLMNETLLSDEPQATGLTMRETLIIDWYRKQGDEIQDYIQLFMKALKRNDDDCGLSYNGNWN